MTVLETSTQLVSSRLSAYSLRRARAKTPLPMTLVVIADLLLIVLAVAAAAIARYGLAYFQDASTTMPLWLGYAMPVAWIGMLALFGAYSTSHLQSGVVEYQRVALASLAFAGSIGVVCYLINYDLSRGFFILSFAIGLPILLLLRLARRRVLNRLRASGYFQQPVMLAGSPAHIDEIAKVLRREKWLGYHIVGAVTPAKIQETSAGVPVLGRVDDVVDLVDGADVHAVIFAEGSFPDSQHFKRMAWELEDQDTHMIVVPAVTDISSERLSPRPVAGLPLVHVDRPQALAASRWGKRAFDIVGSFFLLLMALPVIAAVALAVKLEDRGPVLFKQTRVGRRGENFECLKIRSMVVDAEARKAALESQNEGDGVLFKMARDPRITRIGNFIRRFSIDELPQLWNVFRGDMSLVGPRPALPDEVAQYDRVAERRLDVRPGLTGLWQVSGRSDLPWEEAVRLDVFYVDNWSPLQDLVILSRTAGAVLGSRGAY